MRIDRPACFTLVLLVILLPGSSFPCTTFCVPQEDGVVFGRNLDWMVEDGLVVVNKRGMSKTSGAEGRPARWTSRYGSVTFNQYGREDPMGGVNEAGLIVENMWLEGTEYPIPDSRPELGELEWIQYQLDTAASVDEVIASDSRVRISTERTSPIHFLVCDRGGECATVEFLGGKMIVHRGEDLPVSALANSTYGYSLDYLAAVDRAPGTSAPTGEGHSLERFAGAARGARGFETGAGVQPVDYAFSVLDGVAAGRTQWRIVYDTARGRVYFRTRSHPAIRHLDLASFDYSCAAPVMVLDMALDREGDVTAEFVEYTYEANHRLVRASFGGTPFLKHIPDAVLAAIARRPEQMVCTEGRAGTP